MPGVSHSSASVSPGFSGLVRSEVVSSDYPSPTLPSCACPDQRSVWDIVLSCFATIFACSWIAVHPDIPAPDETWWRITLRRAEYMLWTILTPELILYWAARQWYGAFANTKFQIAEEHGWTMTHGHFVQMGGFTLFSREESKGVLSMDRLNDLAVQGRVKFPQISEKDIQDRSKSDGLSKIFVVGQTTWFILQVLARRLRGLEITELEVTTVAFAALNAAMYYFWWNKPVDVQMSLPISVLPMEESDDEPDLEDVNGGAENENPGCQESSPADTVQSPRNLGRIKAVLATTCLWPLYVVTFMARRLHDMTENFTESRRFDYIDGILDIGPNTVPRFYASITAPRDERKITAFVAIIGTCFGAIHCAAWLFTFPSTIEQWIWRVGSIGITGVPFIFLLMMIPTDGILKAHNNNFRKGIKGFVRTQIVSRMFKTLLPMYGLARLTLVVMALISLRRLPSKAHDVVDWTSFIPHI